MQPKYVFKSLVILFPDFYDGYPENKFRLRILPLQRCGQDSAHACRVFCFCGKARTEFCGHSNTVYASCCVFIMFEKIENPAACEMRSVIRFLNAKNMTPAEIHRQLCDVCGEHAMSSSVVRRWVRLFNPYPTNVENRVSS